MVNVLVCNIVVSEFELKSCYYILFRTLTFVKEMIPITLPAMGWLVQLLFFHKALNNP